VTSTATDTGSGRPLRRDAARNRERILAAAEEVFAERGLEVSLDDVARHAGVGVGTVYRRFPTKELLAEALFEEHLDRLTELVESGRDAEDSWDGLVSVLTAVCAMQATNQGLREIMLSSSYARDHVRRLRDRLTPAITEALARAKADGYLRADIVPADMILVELMVGAAAQYTRHVPDAWRRPLAIIIDGLRAHPDIGPLPVPPLGPDDMDTAMMSWRPPRRPG